MPNRGTVIITRWPTAKGSPRLYVLEFVPAAGPHRAVLRCTDSALAGVIATFVSDAAARRDVMRRLRADGRAVLRGWIFEAPLLDRHWPRDGGAPLPAAGAVEDAEPGPLTCAMCGTALGLGDVLVMADGALVHRECGGPLRDVADDVVRVLEQRPGEDLCHTCVAAAAGATLDEVRKAVWRLRVTADVRTRPDRCGSCRALRVVIGRVTMA